MRPSVSGVLGAVTMIHFVVDVVAGVSESNFFLGAACLDDAFMPLLEGTKPGRIASLDGGLNVEVVAVSDEPDSHGFSQPAVTPE